MESEALPRSRPGSERPGRGPLAGRRILYASTNHAWAFGWTFYQMLAEALAGRNEVVYVDTPTSLARLRPRRWGALLVAAAEREGRLDLLRAAGLPLQRSRWQRSAGGRLAARAVARWAARAGFDPDLVWTFSPWELPLVRRFGAATSVYWTADHLPFVPGERPLLERVDVILAAADPVYEALRARFGARVHPVPVACDFARYHEARLAPAPPPAALAPLERPLFGYAGWVSPRLDLELLRDLAERRTGTVVVAGVRSGLSAERLRAALGPRVVLLGPQSREELPALMRSFDVALVPYRENEFNRCSNPVKFYEYLASGRPTVTTDIPTLRAFGSVASVGSRETFVERALAEAERPTGDEAARVAVAREHSFPALLERLGAVLG